MAMKRTLLELTQDILASLDGDEVTAIADTSESTQVANIIRQCFYEIASTYKLPEHYALFELTETSSSSPTIMTKPTDVITIDWIKYDNKLSTETPTDYREVKFMNFDDFQSMQLGLDSSATDIARFNYTIGADVFPFVHIITRDPTYYTTYNDATVVFDAYKSTEETFLRKTKTMAYGLKESSWTHTDSAVPNLDHKLSNVLFQTAKAQCFSELKQVENPSAERKARRGVLTMIKEKNDIDNKNRGAYWDPNKLPNYGRK
jgi:hypothetical protein